MSVPLASQVTSMGAPMHRPLVFVSQGRISKSESALQHTCSVSGCGVTIYKNALRSGLCRGHYAQAYAAKANTTVQVLKERCCVPQCPRLVYAKARVRGCCRRHYDSMFAAHPAPRALPHDYYTSASSTASRSEAPSTTANISEDDDDDDIEDITMEQTRHESVSNPH